MQLQLCSEIEAPQARLSALYHLPPLPAGQRYMRIIELVLPKKLKPKETPACHTAI